MSTGKAAGFLSIDPTRAAVAGAILAEGTGVNGAGVGDDTGGAGGGIITATGTYYSKPTQMAPGSNSDVCDIGQIVGALVTGTIVAQASNGSDDLDRNGTSLWVDYSSSIVLGSGTTWVIELARFTPARMRLKIVIATLTGTATVESRRVTKGS